MKTYLICLLLAIGIVCPLSTGCASIKPTPQGAAYLALYDTAQLVDSAMRTYGVACASGKVSGPEQEKIDSAHARYRIAFREAVKVARYNWNSASPASLIALSSDIIQAIGAIKK
jgi:hypothetical protein